LLLLLVKGEGVKKIALGFALVELVVAGLVLKQYLIDPSTLTFTCFWITSLGAHLNIGVSGISMLLVLLTAVLTPLIILSTFKHNYANPNAFYALILAMSGALVGVFVANDLLLFYVCWEAALIPIYFIAALWGGENRIAVTFKFFLYTVIGSLCMLVGIMYLYLQTDVPHPVTFEPHHSLQPFACLEINFPRTMLVILGFLCCFCY
jgi:NADH-quinone oxidoreductase subunit M